MDENEGIIDGVLRREGWDRFTDDPADRGGATKWGITQGALSEHFGHQATRQDVRDLTLEDARAFYRWLMAVSRIDQVPDAALRAVVFDAAVNHGRRQGVRLLQRALGLRDDGVIGPVTLAALPHLDGRRVARLVIAERVRLYGRLISGNLTDADRDGVPDNTEFAAGWLARSAELLKEVA